MSEGEAFSCQMHQHLRRLVERPDKLIASEETKITRHGNMLVGGTLGGKSVCWKTLAKAKCILKSMGQEGGDDSHGLKTWHRYGEGGL